jgi:SAM-dependent methyltransferase
LQVRPNPYETNRYLQEYLLFHYGRRMDVCPFSFIPADWLRFHERLREEYLRPVAPRKGSRGLDLGCAVGRFTFELGRALEHVIGLDNSVSFIQAAQRVARHRKTKVCIPVSGSRFIARQLVLPRGLQRSSVEFQVRDALKLNQLGEQRFQVVSAINLLDRLPRPQHFLRQLRHLVAPGGQLLLASPFTWLEDYTPRSGWLSREEVIAILRPHFRLVKQGELPFLIREHRRKYQLVVAEVFSFIQRL